MKGQKKKRNNLVAPTVTSLVQDLVIATDKPAQKIDVEPDKIYFIKENDLVEQKNDVFEIVNPNDVDKSIKPIEEQEKTDAKTIENSIEKKHDSIVIEKTDAKTIETPIENQNSYNLDNVKTFIKKNKEERSNYFKHLYCNIQ